MIFVRWWVVIFDWLHTHLFFSFLTLINRILHWLRCAAFFSDYTEIPAFICLLHFCMISFYRCKMLWHNITVKLLWIQMWLLDILNDNIFILSLYPNFIFIFTLSSSFWLFFCSSFALLYVRGHLQGGSSLSSSVTSSAARRVRQLPQLPPKSSTVEQGTYSWWNMFLTLHFTRYQHMALEWGWNVFFQTRRWGTDVAVTSSPSPMHRFWGYIWYFCIWVNECLVCAALVAEECVRQLQMRVHSNRVPATGTSSQQDLERSLKNKREVTHNSLSPSHHRIRY